MNRKIDINDFVVLMQWVYSMESFNKMNEKLDIKDVDKSSKEYLRILGDYNLSDFKYQSLMEQIYTYKLTNTPVDMSIHNDVEDFMVDCTKVYQKVQKNKDKFHEKINDEEDPINSILPKDFKKETENQLNIFLNIFENCIKNCDFESANMKNIQKTMLSGMLSDLIYEEKYEECAVLRDKINSL